MKKLLLLSLVFISQPSFAKITCHGKVKNILQYSNGLVTVLTDYRNDYTAMCDIDSDRGTVSPETCKGILSVLLTAHSSGKDIVVNYSGDQYACNNLPAYSAAPNPVYVGIKNP
ncbi:hypothetical protein [Vibrio sp. TRT 17S01]|uniref:hypothetical protein n=1 Tax=Vibrio sp. TRT 17S01 TaxID=3418505 RepID=UPI003CECE08F